MKAIGYAALALLIAGGAYAGGYVAPVVEQPVITPVETVAPSVGTWDGFYAGLQYGKGTGDLGNRGALADFGDFDAYGLHAGYQKGFGKFVLGGELDYNKVSPDEVYSDGDLTRLRLRAGYDAGRFLPYVTLGAAKLDTDEFSDTGLTYGLGVDYKVAEHFTVGAEYTRNDFKDVLHDSLGVDGNDLDMNMVQVRASYKF
ncbi:outer membrane protein [Paracoccus aminovorans]|uniref:outer membrane protein n=1 Tax=Paracoccus aminovorans TaxID=34004 RepID=UPI002B25CBF9|nr:porin family protein [Paracoccus aminovorans]